MFLKIMIDGETSQLFSAFTESLKTNIQSYIEEVTSQKNIQEHYKSLRKMHDPKFKITKIDKTKGLDNKIESGIDVSIRSK